MILAVHIVGNGATHGYKLCTGCNGKNPTAWNDQSLNVTQQHTRFTHKPARALVKANEAIQSRRLPQHASRVQADVAITTPHTVSDTGSAAFKLVSYLLPIRQTPDFVFPTFQSSPR